MSRFKENGKLEMENTFKCKSNFTYFHENDLFYKNEHQKSRIFILSIPLCRQSTLLSKKDLG